MYQPISYQTIRQALSWSVMPDPLSVRMVSTFKWPDGTTSGEYILCFEGASVRDAFDTFDLCEGGFTDELAKAAIRDSFCADIMPVRSWVDAQHDKYYVELYGRVTSHSDEWQMPLFGDDDETQL